MLLLALVALPGIMKAERHKPNVIHIMVDELGYYEMSNMGHPDLKTPNLDLLVKDGMRFTQMLAGSSVCGPTRGSLLTGKHTGHATVRGNNGYDPLYEGEETLGTLFKKAGYATGGFGKWGVGARGTTGVPEEHGFDVFFGYYDQVHAHTYYPKYLIRNSEEVPLPGNTGNPHEEGAIFAQDMIYEEARDFIIENRNRPFFCYLPWTPPHGHWGFPVNDTSFTMFKDKEGWPYEAKAYAALVSMIDAQVGKIRSLIKGLGLEKDTIIVFTGDNGGSPYFKNEERVHGFFAPNTDPKTGVRFRGGKRNFYEGGLRVPVIATWPGSIPAGQVSDHLGYFPDFMATYADILKIDAPKGTDGISILPTLLGKEGQKQHEYLYWEDPKLMAVRLNHWKAIKRIEASYDKWELYDLSQDIEETKNVALENPQVLEKLAAFAKEASVPARHGVILRQSLVDKDRDYHESTRKYTKRKE
jgi:arylsulfatase A-like enzyme